MIKKKPKLFFWLIGFSLLVNFFFVAASSAQVADDSTIKLFFGETKIIPGEGINRVLSSDPSVVGVQLLSPTQLQITGNSLGATFIFFWDTTGEHSLRVTVSQMMMELPRAPVAGGYGWFSDFNFGYTGSYSQSDVHYYQSGLNYNTFMIGHFINLGTTIPLGQIQSVMHLQSAAGSNTVLTDWRAYLYGQGYSLGLGDLSASYSEFSVSGIGYQGISFNSIFNGLGYQFDWGARNKPWWGGASGATPDSFYGLKTTLGNFLGADWLLGLGQTADSNGKLQNRAIGLVSRTRWNNWDLTSELGGSNTGAAFRTEANLSDPNYHFSAIFRDIGTNYQGVSGGVSYVGVTGLFLKGDWRPWEKFSTFASYDYYYNTLGSNPARPGYPNSNLSLGVGYDFKPWPFVSLGYFRSDSQGYLSGGVSDGVSAGLSQPWEFIFKYNVYLRYGKSKYQSTLTELNNYSSEAKSGGLNVTIMPNLSLTVDRSYDDRTYSLSGNSESLRTDRADLSWTGPTWFPFSLSSGYISFRSNNASYNYKQYYGNASLSYNIWKNLALSLGGRISETRGEGETPNNRNEKNFYGSVSYSFSTSAVPLQKNLTGIIFEDINGNGKYDSLEPVLAGINLILNDEFSARTDEQGQFNFLNLKPSKIVLKISDLDKTGLVFSPADTFRLSLDAGETESLAIAVQPKTGVKGFVYEDANNNGRFDITEKKLVSMQIEIDGSRTVKTNNDGYFLAGLAPGRHKIKLIQAGLPENDFLVEPEGISFELNEDQVKEVNLAVVNLRSISGIVFIDKNVNRQFDKNLGEIGFAGVQIALDDRPGIVSGRDGSFLLKEVATGPHDLKIKLPPPYKLEYEFNLVVEKNTQGKIDLNFAVSPKFLWVAPIYNYNQLRLTYKNLPQGPGIFGIAPPGIQPQEQRPQIIKVKAFPGVAKPGQAVKIQAAVPLSEKVQKISAVSDNLILSLKRSGKTGGFELWTGVFKVPANYRGRYLEFKIYFRGKKIPETMQNFAVEVVTEPPAKPSAVPAAAEKIIFSETVKLTLVSEPVQKGKELKVFLKLPKEVPVEKVTAFFNQTQVVLEKAAGDEQNQLWQGVYFVPHKIKGNILNFKIFVKATGYPLFCQSKTLRIR